MLVICYGNPVDMAELPLQVVRDAESDTMLLHLQDVQDQRSWIELQICIVMIKGGSSTYSHTPCVL